MPRDEVTDSFRHSQLRRWVGDEPFRERAHGLDHREGVAFTDDPNLFHESGHHRLVALRPGERSDERERLLPRERRKAQLDETLVAGEVVESPAQDRGAGQILLTRRAQHEDGPRPKSTPEERQQAEAHLIAPVEILEDQHHRSLQDEVPD
jgi:hypothetical protein